MARPRLHHGFLITQWYAYDISRANASPGVDRSSPPRCDFGLCSSRVASRANEDGTVAFVTVDPTKTYGFAAGFAFVTGTRDGKRTLTLREAQHEYVYVETP